MVPLVELSELLKMYVRPWQVPVKRIESWFPLFPSEKLAEICGFLIGDGHMQPAPRWRIDFASNNFGTLNYVNSLFQDLFGILGKVRKCTTNPYNTYLLGITCKPLTRTLFLCGVPTGAKVSKEFFVPLWILENKLFFRSFVRAYFSCEACVDSSGRILLEQWKLVDYLGVAQEFMSQIIDGLNKYYGICCNGPYVRSQQNFTKKGLTQGVRVQIRRKADLVVFTRQVGFTDAAKQSKAESLW